MGQLFTSIPSDPLPFPLSFQSDQLLVHISNLPSKELNCPIRKYTDVSTDWVDTLIMGIIGNRMFKGDFFLNLKASDGLRAKKEHSGHIYT